MAQDMKIKYSKKKIYFLDWDRILKRSRREKQKSYEAKERILNMVILYNVTVRMIYLLIFFHMVFLWTFLGEKQNSKYLIFQVHTNFGEKDGFWKKRFHLLHIIRFGLWIQKSTAYFISHLTRKEAGKKKE